VFICGTISSYSLDYRSRFIFGLFTVFDRMVLRFAVSRYLAVLSYGRGVHRSNCRLIIATSSGPLVSSQIVYPLYNYRTRDGHVGITKLSNAVNKVFFIIHFSNGRRVILVCKIIIILCRNYQTTFFLYT
jgi:hypothetical protein